MKVMTYVGGYTDGKREGIHLFKSDTETGAFQPLGKIGGIENVISLAINRGGTRLYAGQGDPELGPRARNGVVAAYAIDGELLTPLNKKPVGATPPCYVSLDPQEKRLVFAEYTNAAAGVFELTADGAFADRPPVTVRHTGGGPDRTRQDRAHAHCAVVSPDGAYLLVVDLGSDRVVAYDYPSCMSGLRELPKVSFRSAPGAGPRHLLFHPNGRLAFVLHELGNTLTSYRYAGGRFEVIQTVSLLPPGFTGFSKAAAVRFSVDGRRLFASNRGHDSIAAFDLDVSAGTLRLKAFSKLAGASPRDFAFLPGGKFALIGHEDSNTIMSYAYDARTGAFTPKEPSFGVYRPVAIVFGKPLNEERKHERPDAFV